MIWENKECWCRGRLRCDDSCSECVACDYVILSLFGRDECRIEIWGHKPAENRKSFLKIWPSRNELACLKCSSNWAEERSLQCQGASWGISHNALWVVMRSPQTTRNSPKNKQHLILCRTDLMFWNSLWASCSLSEIFFLQKGKDADRYIRFFFFLLIFYSKFEILWWHIRFLFRFK